MMYIYRHDKILIPFMPKSRVFRYLSYYFCFLIAVFELATLKFVTHCVPGKLLENLSLILKRK